jgi:hypothetical protein
MIAPDLDELFEWSLKLPGAVITPEQSSTPKIRMKRRVVVAAPEPKGQTSRRALSPPKSPQLATPLPLEPLRTRIVESSAQISRKGSESSVSPLHVCAALCIVVIAILWMLIGFRSH